MPRFAVSRSICSFDEFIIDNEKKVMTDYEKTKDFLDDLGIKYEEDQQYAEMNSEPKDDEVKVILRLVQGTKKVKGYIGFICEFMFDVSGNFIEVDIWE